MKRGGLIYATFVGFFALGVSAGDAANDTACEIPKKLDLNVRDNARLSHLEISRSLGLAAALEAENSASRSDVSSLFKNGFKPIINPVGLAGRYQCRTIKMGGLGPLVVYGWFSCEIGIKDRQLTILKSSGSQRFSGDLFAAGNGLAYRGALHYGYESEPKYYGEDEQRDQVGCLSALDANARHLVLELPEPYYESEHDVIEMVRIK
ncbi:hypothetical protein MNBD_ALPHA12-475 [hydrothermal vent metagenome]|uniref:DUF4893 domain-containing protein n=1 Tax=hydrothermal vent metagenome TaxID=652676 RepID=A0A3B0USD6_9ZZZZ